MRSPRTGLVPRKLYVRDARLFVVATEGEKTEKQYLEMFECQQVHVEVLSTGTDGKSAAKHVLERLATFAEQYDLRHGDLLPDDQLWLMIDVDRQRPQFIEEITQIAVESGYFLAVSNPCFELWLLLHFRDHDEADVECDAVEARLRAHLGSYNKARIDESRFSRPAIERAIQAAKKLDRPENVRWPAYPGTHVYKLVETLIVTLPIA